jgi:hypothetical protein
MNLAKDDQGSRRLDRTADYRRRSGAAYIGPFSREIQLPGELDIERATADLERGILRVRTMHIDTFQVVPALPKRLQRLREIALNLLWSWDEEMRIVFTRLDRDLWESTG